MVGGVIQKVVALESSIYDKLHIYGLLLKTVSYRTISYV